MKIIIAITLKTSAFNTILFLNYCSENLEPSAQDKAIATKAVEAGKVLDNEFCDHIIMSEDGYYSLKDEGCF